MRTVLQLAKSEPVRLYLYGVLGAALALLVLYGILTAELAVAWGGLGATVLAVPAVEAARSRVTPVAALPAAPELRVVDQVLDDQVE